MKKAATTETLPEGWRWDGVWRFLRNGGGIVFKDSDTDTWYACEPEWRIGDGGDPKFADPFSTAQAAMEALDREYPLGEEH